MQTDLVLSLLPRFRTFALLHCFLRNVNNGAVSFMRGLIDEIWGMKETRRDPTDSFDELHEGD